MIYPFDESDLDLGRPCLEAAPTKSVPLIMIYLVHTCFKILFTLLSSKFYLTMLKFRCRWGVDLQPWRLRRCRFAARFFKADGSLYVAESLDTPLV